MFLLKYKNDNIIILVKWLVFFYIYWNRSKNSQNIQNLRDAVAKLAKWNEKRCKKNTTEIIQSITVDFCFIEKSTAIHWIACYSVYDYDRIFVFVFVFFFSFVLSFYHAFYYHTDNVDFCSLNMRAISLEKITLGTDFT